MVPNLCRIIIDRCINNSIFNNIFQRPWYADLGNASDNDYTVGTGVTITSGGIHVTGVVTATTYHGDQIVGTPTLGSFRSGAMASPTVADKSKDQVEEINYILGKLVPTAPKMTFSSLFLVMRAN